MKKSRTGDVSFRVNSYRKNVETREMIGQGG